MSDILTSLIYFYKKYSVVSSIIIIFIYLFIYFLYSYVHTMFGLVFPPPPLPLIPPTQQFPLPLTPQYPAETILPLFLILLKRV
jgi:hypothetical protein